MLTGVTSYHCEQVCTWGAHTAVVLQKKRQGVFSGATPITGELLAGF
jgi:hypothetical protein